MTDSKSSPLTPHRVECGVTPSSSPVTVLYCSVLYGEYECQYCLFVHLIVGVCLFKLRAVRIWSWTLGEAKGGMVVGGGSSCWAGAPWVAAPEGGSIERK